MERKGEKLEVTQVSEFLVGEREYEIINNFPFGRVEGKTSGVRSTTQQHNNNNNNNMSS